MNIVDAVQSNKLKRKLDNDLTEVKELFNNGQLGCHYFEDENGKKHGEYKGWFDDGTLAIHCFYENGYYHGEYKWWWDGTLYEHYLYENGEKIKDYLE